MNESFPAGAAEKRRSEVWKDRLHAAELFSQGKKQAVAKVCASWNLYEHSNGFRARNF
jgi:hypothetical protein